MKLGENERKLRSEKVSNPLKLQQKTSKSLDFVHFETTSRGPCYVSHFPDEVLVLTCG